MSSAVMGTYARLPVTFVRGEGVWLWDAAGERYLDALSGIAVCGLGHAHPAVTEAIRTQAGALLHTSNLYGIESQEALAAELTSLSGMQRVFFGNSGAEANEAAIKIARAHGHARGIDRPEVVVAEGSFHGRTLATLSATGNRRVQAGFEPLVQGFVRVPYDDLEAVRTAARNRPGVVAVLVEPIQGEGGIVVPAEGYLEGLRAICDENGWLLMLDEIQTGMGRTGNWFAFQNTAAVPDVMTLAKALGNGVPIGACLARGAAAEVLGPGSHGSTFGGNPLACSAALAVVRTIRDDSLVEAAAVRGARLQQGLRSSLSGVNCVHQVRGRGLMVGVEMNRPCKDLVQRALEAHVLINVTADRVVRLLPPLVMDEDTIDELVVRLGEIIRAWNAEA